MRLGSSKRPFYRLVATDSRTSRNGKYLEELGYYNPIMDEAVIKIHEDRVVKWLDRGATLTETMRSLLRQEGILQRWNTSKRGGSAVEAEDEISSEELLRRELAQSVEIEATDGAVEELLTESHEG